MDTYRTEDEQVEALRKWWDDNGRSTIFAVIVALGAAFGWRSWQDHNAGQQAVASDLYQAMLQIGGGQQLSAEQKASARDYAGRLKTEHPGTTYAQFAALQLARSAVEAGQLDQAEAELRWVLGKAAAGSDVATVAELRLARVMAASGDPEGALAVLDAADPGTYGGAFALARGDILFSLGRNEEARLAYAGAQAMGAGALGVPGGGSLEQKLQSLSPVPVSEAAGPAPLSTDEAQLEHNAEAADSGDELAGAPLEAAAGESAPDEQE